MVAPPPSAPPTATAPPAADPAAASPAPGTPIDLPTSPPLPVTPATASPFASASPLLRRPTDDFSADTGDEPLWVLPPEVIPPGVLAGAPAGDGLFDPAADARDWRHEPAGAGAFGGPIPGPVRVPGYLDRPDEIRRAGRDPDELTDGLLHDGLPWAFCGPRPPRLGPAPVVLAPGDDTPVDADAGGLAYRQDTDVLTLTGGVDLVRGTERVQAPMIEYHRKTGDVVTTGQTMIDYPGLRIIGNGAALNLQTNQGQVREARYRFTGAFNARGDAHLMEVLNPRLTRYSDITYTACRPGVNAWSLRARDLELNQDTGRGVARHARIRIAGVPVFYSPYLNFPIDDRRKSGFLLPAVGSSSLNGFELITPYYWNIAPQLDATFYPRLMSERGVMLGGELRYLTRRDQGTIRAEVLPSDAKYEGGGSRWAVHLEESGAFGGRWSTFLDYSAVSDDDYLRDFGNTLDVTSTRWLPQRASLYYAGDGWGLLSRLEAYQSVDPLTAPAGRPYGRLPQLQLSVAPKRWTNGLVGNLAAEYNWFDHNHLVDGQRLTLNPSLSWPLRRSYGHLIPGLRAHLSQYALSNTATGQAQDPGHVIPTFDLDGRLVFERPLSWFGNPSVQTLEPRLYYLYTPYVDQADTPVFDSAELDFSFANLFRSNRFTGGDRVGDANQITAGITSRTLDAATGVELFRFSLGQVYYFADRRVQAGAALPETASSSPFAAELAAQLTAHWSGRASVEWDPQADGEQWGRRTVQLQYRSDDARNLVNLAYRYDAGTGFDDGFNDADLSFRLALGDEVGVVGRWLYSFDQNTTTDAFGGVEFGQCCWKLRVLGRHASNGVDEESNTSVMLQLELAGLGALGSPVNSFLEEQIYGYQDE